MASTGVFINDREACSKSADGKSPVATPDPCTTPGPVVVPYPNTSFATDLKKGTTTVLIKNKMVSLKNKSYFSTSIGNEPATEGLSKGVATAVIKGKSYFTSWSQNVKFEGMNVNRHKDFMTHNHGSVPTNTPTFPYIDKGASGTNPCAKEEEKMETECKDKWPDPTCNGLTEKHSYMDKTKDGAAEHNAAVSGKVDAQVTKAKENACLQARKCNLVPYNKSKSKNKDENYCCTGQTGHHMIPGCFFGKCDAYKVKPDADVVKAVEEEKLEAKAHKNKLSREHKKNRDNSEMHQNAPNVCVEGVDANLGTHKEAHNNLNELIKKEIKAKESRNVYTTTMTIDEIIPLAAKAHLDTFGATGCTQKCIEAQLTAYYKQNDTPCPEVKTKKVGGGSGTEKKRSKGSETYN